MPPSKVVSIGRSSITEDSCGFDEDSVSEALSSPLAEHPERLSAAIAAQRTTLTREKKGRFRDKGFISVPVRWGVKFFMGVLVGNRSKVHQVDPGVKGAVVFIILTVHTVAAGIEDPTTIRGIVIVVRIAVIVADLGGRNHKQVMGIKVIIVGIVIHFLVIRSPLGRYTRVH